MKWEEEGYLRHDAEGNEISIEDYEKQAHKKKRFCLTTGDMKLFAITGVGFFLDSYDLFIINLVSPVWAFEYWGGLEHKTPHFPPLLRGAVNAASNIGNIMGQVTFGFLGDSFGRKFVYGKELIVCIIGTILVISLPNNIPSPTKKMIWIFIFRMVMGIGIGGDYPMSASIVSERSNLKTRGRLLAWIFSNQGWGTLAGSIVTIIILKCFSKSLDGGAQYGQLDGVWRIQMGLGLVPAFATLYFRLTMPEGLKFQQSQELNTPKSSPSESSGSSQSRTPPLVANANKVPNDPHPITAEELELATAEVTTKRKFDTFFVYFSEWRHLKTLLGTTSSWFLLDIAFYGTNLNQSVLLTEIGFSTGKNEYHVLLRNAVGNLIMAVSGYVPGYFFTIFLVEILGRRWIQIQGFLICALMFAILAGDYGQMGTAGKFVCFAIAQFFFNFGPNATTFIIPAEAFPSRVRGLAHGLSAAIGKLGAILAALLFNWLSTPQVIGLPNVLWIFFACNILGAISTYFLILETKGRDADAVDYEEWKEAHLTNTLREASETGPPTVENTENKEGRAKTE